MYEVHIVAVGYSKAMENSEGYTANCSCTLIKGKYNIIVDTMTPWDREYILESMYLYLPHRIHERVRNYFK